MKPKPPMFVRGVNSLISVFAGIAAVALLVMLFLTVTNIGLRLFGDPYAGTFELVSFLSVIVVGMSLALAQRYKTHVAIDIVVTRWSTRAQLWVGAVITLFAAVIFFLLGQELVSYALNLRDKGSVSDSLRWPYWPLAITLAIGIFGLVLALISDLVQIFRNLRSSEPQSIW